MVKEINTLGCSGGFDAKKQRPEPILMQSKRQYSRFLTETLLPSSALIDELL
ncbi:hypothetical protein MMA231_01250 [Asticcacaulis sp. MM231]